MSRREKSNGAENFAIIYSANILTLLSTAFGSVAFATMIWLNILQPKIAVYLKLYSSMSVSVMCTAFGCDNHSQISVANVTQPNDCKLAVKICSF